MRYRTAKPTKARRRRHASRVTRDARASHRNHRDTRGTRNGHPTREVNWGGGRTRSSSSHRRVVSRPMGRVDWMMKSNFFPNLPSFAFLAGDVVTSGCFLGPLPFRAPARWVRVPRLESISPVFPSASSDGYRQTHFFTKRYFSSSARRHASARVGKKGTLTTSEHCVCGGVGTRAAFSRVFRRTPRSRNRFGRCRRQKSIGNAIGVSISHPISYLCRFFGGRRLR